MNDIRPFEEYKEMIKDMPKEEMIRGLYDLSKNIIDKENEIKTLMKKYENAVADYESEHSIIKEVREYIKNIPDDEFVESEHFTELLEILDKENK